MVKITARLTPQHLTAVERAAQHRAAGLVPVAIGYRKYSVPSATGAAVYTVEIRNPGKLEATCTCIHGSSPEARGICWHKAAAICEETRRISRPPTKLATAFVRSFTR